MGEQLSILASLHDAQLLGFSIDARQLTARVGKWDEQLVEFVFVGVVTVRESLSTEHELNALCYRTSGAAVDEARVALRELDYPATAASNLHSFEFVNLDDHPILTVVATDCLSNGLSLVSPRG